MYIYIYKNVVRPCAVFDDDINMIPTSLCTSKERTPTACCVSPNPATCRTVGSQ